jgi:type I restriction enzyme, R subunit
VGIVEAKRRNQNVLEVLRQAERNAEGFRNIECELFESAPWGRFRAPFAFSTNGRPYLCQIETLSGIWRRDLRVAENAAEALVGQPSPEGIQSRLRVHINASNAASAAQVWDFGFPLRPYQRQAIEAVEGQIARGAKALPIAMATGTGKTM